MAQAQQSLWHDRIEDALRDVVYALGGAKKVGSNLWPEKTIQDAARLLNHCLDPDRSEKLELGQFMLLMRWAREADCHVAMHYLAGTLNYEEPKPKCPETERDRIQREFIQAQQQMERLVQRMGQLGGAA